MSGKNRIDIARIYDEPGTGDESERILVDRLWPRGVSKERAHLTLWLREIAPSTELRKWYDHDPEKLEEFAHRYREELGDAERSAALDRLRDLTQQGPVTLLTASKALDISHAAVLRDLLTDG